MSVKLKKNNKISKLKDLNIFGEGDWMRLREHIWVWLFIKSKYKAHTK